MTLHSCQANPKTIIGFSLCIFLTLASGLHSSAWRTCPAPYLYHATSVCLGTLLLKSPVIGLFTHNAISNLSFSSYPLSADNLIYSLQNDNGIAKWLLFYPEVLLFTLSLPVYLQTCTSQKQTNKKKPLLDLCQLLSWSHLWLISLLRSLRTKSQWFQWFPSSLKSMYFQWDSYNSLHLPNASCLPMPHQ